MKKKKNKPANARPDCKNNSTSISNQVNAMISENSKPAHQQNYKVEQR